MYIENKDLTKLVKSVKAALKRDHNTEVPHSALRASLLAALGENPHAFSSKTQGQEPELRDLIKEAPHYFHPGYDFDGKKLQWLKRAGLVPADEGRQDTTSAGDRTAQDLASDTHVLYLVGDDIGVMECLALDPEGDYKLPEDFDLSGCSLVGMHAELPRIKKYGLPDYYAKPAEFFERHFGLRTSSLFRQEHEDLGDDSGDACKLAVLLPKATWHKLVREMMQANPGLKGDAAEWVGLHYGKNFDTETTAKRSMWVERFIEAHYSAADMEDVDFVEGTFEWLWPDQDSDSVPCLVDMRTGALELKGEPPEHDSSIDFRFIAEEDYSEMFPAWYKTQGPDSGKWFLTKEALRDLREYLGL
jgi:hypothetical protein